MSAFALSARPFPPPPAKRARGNQPHRSRAALAAAYPLPPPPAVQTADAAAAAAPPLSVEKLSSTPRAAHERVEVIGGFMRRPVQSAAATAAAAAQAAAFPSADFAGEAGTRSRSASRGASAQQLPLPTPPAPAVQTILSAPGSMRARRDQALRDQLAQQRHNQQALERAATSAAAFAAAAAAEAVRPLSARSQLLPNEALHLQLHQPVSLLSKVRNAESSGTRAARRLITERAEQRAAASRPSSAALQPFQPKAVEESKEAAPSVTFAVQLEQRCMLEDDESESDSDDSESDSDGDSGTDSEALDSDSDRDDPLEVATTASPVAAPVSIPDLPLDTLLIEATERVRLSPRPTDESPRLRPAFDNCAASLPPFSSTPMSPLRPSPAVNPLMNGAASALSLAPAVSSIEVESIPTSAKRPFHSRQMSSLTRVQEDAPDTAASLDELISVSSSSRPALTPRAKSMHHLSSSVELEAVRAPTPAREPLHIVTSPGARSVSPRPTPLGATPAHHGRMRSVSYPAQLSPASQREATSAGNSPRLTPTSRLAVRRDSIDMVRSLLTGHIKAAGSDSRSLSPHQRQLSNDNSPRRALTPTQQAASSVPSPLHASLERAASPLPAESSPRLRAGSVPAATAAEDGALTVCTQDLPDHPLALQLTMLANASSMRQSKRRLLDTTATVTGQDAASTLPPRFARGVSVPSPAARGHMRSVTSLAGSSQRFSFHHSSRAVGVDASHHSLPTSPPPPAARTIQSQDELSVPQSKRKDSTRRNSRGSSGPGSRKGSRRSSTNVPLDVATGEAAPAAPLLPGESDPKNLSFVPALRLDKPLTVSVTQKLFDGRFIRDVPLDAPVDRPPPPTSRPLRAKQRLKHVSMSIAQASAVARVLSSLTKDTAQEEEEKQNADADTDAAETVNASPALSAGGDGVALSSLSLHISSSPDESPTTSAFGSPRNINVSSFIVPATPHGLPALRVPLMLPSALDSFAAKWGPHSARQHSADIVEDPAALWTLPAGQTTRREKQLQPALQKRRDEEGEDASMKPLWVRPSPAVLQALASGEINVFQVKMDALQLESARAAEAAALAERGEPSAEERAQAERNSHVFVAQSADGILAALSPRHRTAEVSYPAASSPDQSHRRHGSDVPSEFAAVSVSEGVIDAVLAAELDPARTRVLHGLTPADGFQADWDAQEDAAAEQARAEAAAAALRAAEDTEPIYDLEVPVTRRGTVSFAAEQRAIEDELQEVRVAADDDSDDEEELDDEAREAAEAAEANRQIELWNAVPATASTLASAAKSPVLSPGSSPRAAARKNVTFDALQLDASDGDKSAEDAQNLPVAFAVEPTSSPVRPSSARPASQRKPSVRPHSAASARTAVASLYDPSLPSFVTEVPPVDESAREQLDRIARAQAYFNATEEEELLARVLDEASSGGADAAAFFSDASSAAPIDDNTRARLLGVGFEPFDERTHMVCDGMILLRPSSCKWPSRGEEVLESFHRRMNGLDHAGRSTRKEIARARASRERIAAQPRAHSARMRRAAGFVPKSSASSAAREIEETQEQEIQRLAREQEQRHQAEIEAAQAVLEREQQLQARAAVLESKRHGPVWVSPGRPNSSSKHRAAQVWSQFDRPQSARAHVAGTLRDALHGQISGLSTPMRPQTARPAASNTELALSSVPVFSATPPHSGSQSARPFSARSSSSLARGGRGALDLARAVHEVNEVVLLSSLAPDGSARRSPQKGGRAASAVRAATPARSQADSSFIQPSAVASALTAGVIRGIVRERPHSALAAADLALPLATLRPAEAVLALAESSRRAQSLLSRNLAAEAVSERERRRRERAAAIQAHQHSLLAELHASPSAERARMLVAQISGSRKQLHSSGSSASDVSARSRGGGNPKRSATEKRMEIEREVIQYASQRHHVFSGGVTPSDSRPSLDRDTSLRSASSSNISSVHTPLLLSAAASPSIGPFAAPTPSPLAPFDALAALLDSGLAPTRSGHARTTRPQSAQSETAEQRAAAAEHAAHESLLREERAAPPTRFVLPRALPAGSTPAEQLREDAALLRAVESSPVWRRALQRLRSEDDQRDDDEGDLDRRILTLIAAGEHELQSTAEQTESSSGTLSPTSVADDRALLLDGVRCLRAVASRRLEQLYGGDEHSAFSVDDLM